MNVYVFLFLFYFFNPCLPVYQPVAGRQASGVGVLF